MDARWLQEPAASEQGVAMRADARLRIRTEACLPRRFPAFACRRCADACPSHALLPTPQGPHLSSGCTDCGRCAARCPTEALSVPGFGPVRLSDSGPAAGPISIDCWRVAPGLTPAGGLRVPCLGGLAPAWLLELVASAAGRPVHLLDRGLCAACPSSGPADDADNAADDHCSAPQPVAGTAHPASRCLRETGHLLLAIRLEPHLWPRLTDVSAAPATEGAGSSAAAPTPAHRPEPLLEARLSRRALFAGRLARAPGPPQHDPAPPAGEPGPLAQPLLPERRRRRAALHRLAPAAGLPAHLFPALAITAACANHGLCTSACPSGALQRYRADGEQGHRFDPGDCTACGLCVALCPEQAIELRATAPYRNGPVPAMAPQTLTRFSTHPCRDCGAEVPGDDPLCPACTRDREFARSAFQTLFAPARADT
jgi:ferredoxin